MWKQLRRFINSRSTLSNVFVFFTEAYLFFSLKWHISISKINLVYTAKSLILFIYLYSFSYMLAVNSFNGACQHDRPPLLSVEQYPSSINLTGPQTVQAMLSTNHRLIHGVNIDFSNSWKEPNLRQYNPESAVWIKNLRLHKSTIPKTTRHDVPHKTGLLTHEVGHIADITMGLVETRLPQ